MALIDQEVSQSKMVDYYWNTHYVTCMWGDRIICIEMLSFL